MKVTTVGIDLAKRKDRNQEADTARPDGRVLRKFACLPFWHGGLR